MSYDNVIIQTLEVFSIIGVIVFSISGALVAAHRKMDILGFILIGTVTAIGGGTLRDLLLGISPVMWIQHPSQVYLCILASVGTYFLIRVTRKRYTWMLWMDSIGLAAFAITGTQVALSLNVPPIIAVTMGVMTATFGGILRDVLCAEPLTLMRKELYISCALFGSLVYVVLDLVGLAASLTAACSFVAGFGLRAAAILYDLELPGFGRKKS